MNGASTPQYADKEVSYNESFTLEAAPVRPGYKFLGWQIYSGATESPYKENVSTITDPLKRNVNIYNASSSVKNMRTGSGTVVMCAIWEHIDITVADNLESLVTWSGIFLDDSDEFIYKAEKIRPYATGAASPKRLYYINTNNITSGAFNRIAKVTSSSGYIKINSYGVNKSDNGGSYNYITTKSNVFLNQTSA